MARVVDAPATGRERKAGSAAARAAAERAGVTVKELHALADLAAVRDLYDRVWRPLPTNPLVTVEQLRALTHAGNYLAGAFDGDRMVGATMGFFAAPPGRRLHSHISGVSGEVRGRGVGFALKLHQRAWALDRGLAEITWTFDPLVRRNAHVNLAKLAARPREYLVDFYGDIGDELNAGQGSDRLLVVWDLAAREVADACAGRSAEVDADALVRGGARVALADSGSGRPEVGPARRAGRGAVLVRIPPDIEALRRDDPRAAREWRLAVRETLGGLLAEGGRVTGFDREGWYVVERGSGEARRT